jgi:hypothetical protein
LFVKRPPALKLFDCRRNRRRSEIPGALKKEMTVTTNSKENLKTQAEASFKKAELVGEDAKAKPQYEAEGRAVAEKTERLRALRLAKEGAENS